MPPEQRIELKILLHSHRSPAAPELERPQLTSTWSQASDLPPARTQRNGNACRSAYASKVARNSYALLLTPFTSWNRVREISNTRHTHRFRLQLAFVTDQKSVILRKSMASLPPRPTRETAWSIRRPTSPALCASRQPHSTPSAAHPIPAQRPSSVRSQERCAQIVAHPPPFSKSRTTAG